jgi:hypothetical protein
MVQGTCTAWAPTHPPSPVATIGAHLDAFPFRGPTLLFALLLKIIGEELATRCAKPSYRCLTGKRRCRASRHWRAFAVYFSCCFR